MSTLTFGREAYGDQFAELLVEDRRSVLGPGAPNTSVRLLLDALTVEAAFAPQTIQDMHMAKACLSGIWLYHDFLEESHHISQSIPTASGSFWHGIMHRREPDSWNSKYWFERVGHHPIFPALRDVARELAEVAPPLPETVFLIQQGQWNPFAFIDLCELCREGKLPATELCRDIQQKEWQLLFDHCYRRAVSSAPDR